MLADRPGWAFDRTARELAQRLRGKLDLQIAYVLERPRFDVGAFDFLYVFWWGENYHLPAAVGRVPIIKEVSSERWRYDPRFRAKDDAAAVQQFMSDAEFLVATSERLARAISKVHPRVFEYRLGVNASEFYPAPQPKVGDLRVGWAGRSDDPAKGFGTVFVPGTRGRYHVRIAGGTLPFDAMPAFYRELDVFCVTSKSEGTPLPLLEAMASGCFPVSTRVGVAEEVIRDGVDGLLINPDVNSLRAALAWCEQNREFVRAAGRENAKRIVETRSWERSAEGFLRVLNQLPLDTMTKSRRPGYRAHFARINPGEDSEAVFRAQCIAYEEEFAAMLPAAREARILEIGPGYGHLIRWLRAKGYTAIETVERDEELAHRLVEKHLLPSGAVHCAEATDWLVTSDSFDLVILCDVIEHLATDRARLLLSRVHACLRPGGRVLLRTPNMANLLGGYSRYIDLTHETGFTEWSLLTLLNEAGFDVVGVLPVPRYASRRRRWRAKVQRVLHRWLYRLDDRTMPSVFAKNLVAWGRR